MDGDDAAQVSRAGATDVTTATAATAASSDSGIQFNNRMCKDWFSALSALRQLKSKNHASTTSGWYCSDVIVGKDDSFALWCRTCHNNFWSSHRKACTVSKELRDVALRLLSAHATSTASKRNWSLWGRIYCASRSSLGMERTKALIAICTAEKANTFPSEEVELTLSVIEGTD
jgi:hypothetical protein